MSRTETPPVWHMRPAYLAPEGRKQRVEKREITAVTLMDISDCAPLTWPEHSGVVFGAAPDDL